MHWWQAIPDFLSEGDLVLVTVVAAQGSAPRDAGTSMVVSRTRMMDTIGGGHLEYQAINHSRTMLEGDRSVELKRFSLAASLGQCCGGVVWLLFEKIAASSLTSWKHRIEQLQQGQSLRRDLRHDGEGSTFGVVDHEEAFCYLTDIGSNCLPSLAQDGIANWQLRQSVDGPTLSVTIFGAGHVGMAIARLLCPLDVQVRLVDQREDLLAQAPSNVLCIATDAPQEGVATAPKDSYFIVLTHDHSLDCELCYHILKRDDFAWFGLIGSKSKRAKFEHRLVERGIAQANLAKMCCPIGIPGIRSKAPQAIAIAVAAQLLKLWENDVDCA